MSNAITTTQPFSLSQFCRSTAGFAVGSMIPSVTFGYVGAKALNLNAKDAVLLPLIFQSTISIFHGLNLGMVAAQQAAGVKNPYKISPVGEVVIAAITTSLVYRGSKGFIDNSASDMFFSTAFPLITDITLKIIQGFPEIGRTIALGKSVKDDAVLVDQSLEKVNVPASVPQN